MQEISFLNFNLTLNVREEYEMNITKFDVAIILSALSVIVVFAVTALTELHWVAHALGGVFSLCFSVAAALVGAMLTGRIRKKVGTNLFRLHKKISAYLTVLVVSTFFLGIWDRVFYGEPLFWQHTAPLAMVVQGWFGLVVTIMAIAQAVPCFVVKDKRKTRKLHMILGYALVIALVIQTFLGVEAILVEIAGG